MWSHPVVILAPVGQQRASLAERREQRHVEALVAKPPDDALRKRVLLRLAGGDIVPVGVHLLHSLQDRDAGQLCAVVGDARHRLTPCRPEQLQHAERSAEFAEVERRCDTGLVERGSHGRKSTASRHLDLRSIRAG